MNRVLDQWSSLPAFFQDQSSLNGIDKLSKTKALTILEAMRDPSAKLYYFFLSYILKIVNDLNKEFQSEGPKIHVLYERMCTIFSSVLRNFMKKEVMDRVNIAKINLHSPANYVPVEHMYMGVHVGTHIIDINAADANEFRLNCLNFYIALASSIRNRFDFKSDLLKLVGAFKPAVVLSGSVPDVMPVM